MSWCSDAPEDEAICLFAGLLANPDMTLSLRAFAFLQYLIRYFRINETVGENFMFSGYLHDFETFLVHKSLNVPIDAHRTSKYINTVSREHVTCEMMDNIRKENKKSVS